MRQVRLDGSRISSKIEFLDAVAEALDFPDYFGRNWDALDECLADITEPTVVVWVEPGGFADADPRGYQTAVRTFTGCEAPVELQLVADDVSKS